MERCSVVRAGSAPVSSPPAVALGLVTSIHLAGLQLLAWICSSWGSNNLFWPHVVHIYTHGSHVDTKTLLKVLEKLKLAK